MGEEFCRVGLERWLEKGFVGERSEEVMRRSGGEVL